MIYGERLFLEILAHLFPINELPKGYMSRDAVIEKTVVLDMADIALRLESAPLLMTNGQLK